MAGLQRAMTLRSKGQRSRSHTGWSIVPLIWLQLFLVFFMNCCIWQGETCLSFCGNVEFCYISVVKQSKWCIAVCSEPHHCGNSSHMGLYSVTTQQSWHSHLYLSQPRLV